MAKEKIKWVFHHHFADGTPFDITKPIPMTPEREQRLREIREECIRIEDRMNARKAGVTV
jgi:hypothetical protein